MLIVCPSCASDYTVEPSRIGVAGRRVRCAACRESWFVPPLSTPPHASETKAPQLPAGLPPLPVAEMARPLPPLPDPAVGGSEPTVDAEPIVIEPEPHGLVGGDVASRAKQPQRRRRSDRVSAKPRDSARSRALRRAAAACVAALVLVVPGLMLGREQVVRVLPRSAALYAAVGLRVNVAGFDLERVTSSIGQEGDASVLLVEGSLRNVGRASRATPLLLVGIEAEDGAPLYRWTVKAPEAELEAGQATPFRARLASPPPRGRRVTVTLKDAPEDRTVALR